MNNHQINAAHNSFHWTIAFNQNGEIAHGPIMVSKDDLYTLFECDCGAEFDTKQEAIAHLNKIDADESGGAVRQFANPAGQ